LQEKAQNVTIFVSSRLEVPVSQFFKDMERIRVYSSENSIDIKEFIEREFRKSERRNIMIITDRMTDDLKNILIARVEGI
jgi:hypothetical protein